MNILNENIKINRVSEKKLRIKYNLPIYYKIDNEITLLDYQKISITLRESEKHGKKGYIYIYQLKPNQPVYNCARPFNKYYTKILNIYNLKNTNNLNIHFSSHDLNFENINIYLIIPKHIILQGNGIKEMIRKRKIKKILFS